MRKTFETIYDNMTWGLGSGSGSWPEGLRPYYHYLDKLLQTALPATVLDVGCGRFAAYEQINWQQSKYIGIDIAKQCIDENQRYANSSRTFMQADWLDIPNLPKADLVICKDVLQHWNTDDVWRGLQILSKYERCLITNSVVLGNLAPNLDIKTGSVRPLNLIQKPFCVTPSDYVKYDVVTNTNDTKLIILWEPGRHPLP